MNPLKHDISKVAEYFQVKGRFVSAEPYGTGHINDTYAGTYDHKGARIRYIHQRINHKIFKNPVALMENIVRVTHHQRKKLKDAGCKDLARHALTVVPARDGLPQHTNSDGNTWRTYVFIDGARTYDVIETPVQAMQAAKAFGEFQQQLVDLPGGRLHETIPDFHNTPKRFEALEKAIHADCANRAKDAAAEIKFALSQKGMVGTLIGLQKKGAIPERVTHNDTKVNNVMLDDKTNEGVCVIDLDTVMPGLALYDFGDLVRTATNSAAEDERDLSKVYMVMEMFEAITKGYAQTARGFLNKTETEHLAFSGKLITFEIGIRFLTDYLAGDVYFKVHRPGHNLDRCRTQFKLVQSITEQEEKMNGLVRSEFYG